MTKPCPFCLRIASGDVESRNSLAVAFRDQYPVSPGHTLVVPSRHVTSLFDVDEEELKEVWSLIGEAKLRVAAERQVDGWNIGTNIGDAGGQTVHHAHVHLIPRYRGDVEDPRGGVRGVIPIHRLYPSVGDPA